MENNKIVFFGTHSYDRHAFTDLNKQENLGFDLIYHRSFLDLHNADETHGAKAVCIFVNDRADREVLKKLKENNVEILALRCAGFNNVDLASAKEFGIKVVRVPAYSPHAIAEHVIALILTLNRKTHRAYSRTRDGNFALHGLMGFDLYGKTAGVIGTGKIARVLIGILQGFGINVIAYDVFEDKEYEKKSGIKYVSLDELYEKSDIISLNCPLTQENKYLINKDSIAKMKDGVMIINTGRGPLINSEDLVNGLKSGKIGAAGLDVYEEEHDYFYQDRSDQIITDDNLSRLMSLNNVLITSHQAFFTQEAMHNIVSTTLHNVKDYFEGKELVNEVSVQS
ncbi:MAG: 2-hydroxyacid dehydrogenase [Succinivibrio sp.]|uniref:2-hydroxyacid dehydrogenase n=1 Tax=Succinivibrio sp. TaxID=2053619 RepID=UPI002F938EDC